MSEPTIVDDLINQVRDQLDEANSITVSDDDILQALNRSQRHAANIIAKHYEELFLELTTFTSVTGTDTYDITEDAYASRIEHVLVENGGYDYPLRRISYREVHRYTSVAQVQIPSVYAIFNRQIIIKPKPSGSVLFKYYYFRKPETMVKSQGRITSVDTSSGFFLLDAIGSSLSTSVSDLTAFINVVDAHTGKVKSSHQIASIDTSAKKVTIKTSGLGRSTLFGKTIATTIPSTVEQDDHLCLINGSAVSEIPEAFMDYFIQYAVTEIRRRLGEPVGEEFAQLRTLEREIERMWVGREHVKQVARKNKHFLRA